ncbi:molybdopterin synthase subunit MoaD [Pseudoxanthomonas sp. GM95]|uniref:MoaD/ThiS family protein n=1 Tax=Pseudoxanthomonas sp. GM95 TaxID=1881043 RepID=UPI0008CCE91E|nr:MoaD/ThiS family protein [Pseudoxanthomonas sp. GM95]SEK73698.1 molybdopterin synthase subunit MoaD [Pseudoxanthomonas sp. GM95]
MTGVQVLYFASLRQAAGVEGEAVQTAASDLAGLYAELRTRHGFAWDSAHLRVAVDGAFARWEDAPAEGAQIAFIPPVSGG